MNTRFSPYDRPWIWLMRETSVIALLLLAAWIVAASGLAGVAQALAIAGLIAVALVLTIRMITDILVAGFCQWFKAMGRGVGVLVSSVRYAWCRSGQSRTKRSAISAHERFRYMKRSITSTEIRSDTVRAGLISSLILAICYLALTGLSDFPRVFAFIGLFAVCFVLMMKSIVDMLAWIFGLAARGFGMSLGHSVRLTRHLLLRWKSQRETH